MNKFVRIEFKDGLVMYCTLYYINRYKIFTSNGFFMREDIIDIEEVGKC